MAAKKGKTTKKAGTKGKKAQNSYSFRDEIIILLTWREYCMAAKKGKTTKKAGTKGKKAQNSYSFRDEIIILLTLAVAILLILSNFGLGGFLGNAVSAFLFGIFGSESLDCRLISCRFYFF